ncbi:hypothetical protein PR048_002249 [Dryococelus australis]|uniref:Uncharacterized protein n=1 Tax=Dryococelus australis TaxID=614101 RepID=A0ABQ9IM57_9NEOP|nr:hypothetical protein PR048_002249 [Dryococelus australis]
MIVLMKFDDSSTSDISSDSEPDGVIEDCRPEESSSDECFLESGSSPGDTCVVVSNSSPTGLDSNNDSGDFISVIEVPDRLFGKNKFKWCDKNPNNIRCPARNNVLHLPWDKGAARNINCGIEAWNLFFTENVLTDIAKHTNAKIVVQCAKYTSVRYQNNVDDADEAPLRP